MGMASGLDYFLLTDEGLAYRKSIGMEGMATWFGNMKQPLMYFLQDEPDAQDYGVGESKEPFRRLGALAQGLVEKSRTLRKKDPVTPQLLNMDNTFKPDNWYTYAQHSDLPCADPYYAEQLRGLYLKAPGAYHTQTKPTYVKAVTQVCQSACAPKPGLRLSGSVCFAGSFRSTSSQTLRCVLSPVLR